jgi:DNA repair exonuclease SbcCD ATPase subunit
MSRKDKASPSADDALTRLPELHNKALKLCAGPHNMDDLINPILSLLRRRRVSQAEQSLEQLKEEVAEVLTMLWGLILSHIEKINEQEVEMAELRIQVIEGAMRYAKLNNDPECIAIGEELLSQQTLFVTAAIADLDPDR